MVKQGKIKLDMREQEVRYIETYADAPNSYGTMLREPIIIGIQLHPSFLGSASPARHSARQAEGLDDHVPQEIKGDKNVL